MRLLKKALLKIPGVLDLHWLLHHYHRELHPRGHYYSPLPDIEKTKADAAKIYDPDVDLGPSIDLREDAQRALLEEFAQYYGEFPWLEPSARPKRFYLDQGYYRHADALTLYSMMRHLKPKRVVEAGSGFSSALMLDTNDLFLDGGVRFTFIEPYPERLMGLLSGEDKENHEILDRPVQEVPLSCFEKLEAGDILFVDSSHVVKVGGDVNYLFFHVLPALKPGVAVHFHDIFWPFEYPLKWVESGKSWSEAYLMRAFLQYNGAFEVLLFNSYMGHVHKVFLERKMPLFLEDTGGALWLRKTAWSHGPQK